MRKRRFLVPLLLCAAVAQLVAQDPIQRFQLNFQAWESAKGNHGPANLRYLEQIVRQFGSIDYDDHDKLRLRAEGLLRQIATKRGVAETYRLRVAALETLAHFARDRRSAQLFFSMASSRSREYEDLHFWVGRAIAGVEEPAFLRELARRGFEGKRKVRATLLSGLAQLKHDDLREIARKEFADPILTHCGHKVAALRRDALRAAGHLGIISAFPELLRASLDPDPLVRRAAAFSLGRLCEQRRRTGRGKGLAFFAGIEALLIDPDARVREDAVRALQESGEIRAVPLLLGRLAKEPLRLRSAIYDALEKLSGKSIERELSAWRSWWQVVGPGLLAKAEGGSDVPSVALRGGQGASRRYAPTYYGLPVLSDRVVFVLDISGSMAWGGDLDKRPRIKVAKEELLSVLSKLDERTRFTLIAFSGSNILFNPKGLVPANKSWLRKAERFVERLSPGGGTNTWGALKCVLERYPEADTIYLLSDGSPTLGKVRIQGQIIARLAEKNRLPGVRVHTISLLKGNAPNRTFAELDDKDDAARFMKQIAEVTHGTFVRVEK